MNAWVHVCAHTCARTLRGAEGVIPLLIHLFPLLERSRNPRTLSLMHSTLHRILNANKHTHSPFFFFLNEGQPYCIITFDAVLISAITGCFQGSAFFPPEVSLLQRARSADLASHRRLSLEFLFQTRQRSVKAFCKVIFLYAALGNLV